MMKFPQIKINKSVLIFSFSPNQIEKIEKFIDKKDENIIILLGKLSDDSKSIDDIENNISKLNNFMLNKNCFYIISDDDLILKEKNKYKNNNINLWIENQCLGINCVFNNSSQLTVVHGGISPSTKSWKELFNNIEIAFIKNINNKPWHHSYDGRFGFVISSHVISEKIEIYDFSASISVNDNICIQEFTDIGLGKTILI